MLHRTFNCLQPSSIISLTTLVFEIDTGQRSGTRSTCLCVVSNRNNNSSLIYLIHMVDPRHGGECHGSLRLLPPPTTTITSPVLVRSSLSERGGDDDDDRSTGVNRSLVDSELTCIDLGTVLLPHWGRTGRRGGQLSTRAEWGRSRAWSWSWACTVRRPRTVTRDPERWADRGHARIRVFSLLDHSRFVSLRVNDDWVWNNSMVAPMLCRCSWTGLSVLPSLVASLCDDPDSPHDLSLRESSVTIEYSTEALLRPRDLFR